MLASLVAGLTTVYVGTGSTVVTVICGAFMTMIVLTQLVLLRQRDGLAVADAPSDQ
jgi:hypothetical protein